MRMCDTSGNFRHSYTFNHSKMGGRCGVLLKSYYKNKKSPFCKIQEFRDMTFLMYYIFNIHH